MRKNEVSNLTLNYCYRRNGRPCYHDYIYIEAMMTNNGLLYTESDQQCLSMHTVPIVGHLCWTLLLDSFLTHQLKVPTL